MENLFEKWKTRLPKYREVYKELFDLFSQKYGAEGEKKTDRGKHFSTHYELYIFAFFLGLYKNEFSPIQDGEKKTDFSQTIQYWGNKTSLIRKNFSGIQENIFTALIAKTEIDLVALEKGDLDEDEIVKQLIRSMESYTNGGLSIIKEKYEDSPNYFLQPTCFLNLILESSPS